MGPPVPPVLELPKPPADLRAARKGDRITLTWSIPERTTDRQRVRYLGKTRVCRSLDAALVQCGAPVGETAPALDFSSKKDTSGKKLTASYTDILPRDLQLHNLFGSATYAVEVFNRDGRAAGLSNQVQVPLAETLAPPTDFAARVTAHGVVLTWTAEPSSLPPSDQVRRGYRVYRRAEGSQQNILVGEREAGTDKDQSLTDPPLAEHGFDWEKTYYYHVDTFTTITQPAKPEVSIEGDSTRDVKVFTHDVFPPAVPSGLQAVFSGPGQQPFIDLIWSPVADADLEGYNIYRHELGSMAIQLNSQPMKTPAFRDSAVVAGKKYFYSVSAIDQRGNESARSEEAGESVP
jgi:hypothetical protein